MRHKSSKMRSKKWNTKLMVETMDKIMKKLMNLIMVREQQPQERISI